MNIERLINEFIEMVQIPSLSLKEKEFSNVLINKLKELGMEVYVDNAGEKCGGNTGNVIAKLKGTANVPPVLFGAHMDTVTPGEKIKPQIKDGVIYSDGTTILGADDKAGIAAILEAIRHIKENNIPHGDIELAFTIAEEGGLYGAKYLDYSKISSKTAFILDSSGEIGDVIIQGPAQMKIYTTIKGRAAHAGVSPESGISAIQVAARAVNSMKLLRIDEETTANVGVITGGTATNIVCDSVYMRFEARSLKKEKAEAQIQHMVECIENACRDFSTTADIEIEHSYPAFKVEADTDIIKLVDSAVKNIGMTPQYRSTGGGSDTNVFNGNGISAVTLAIGMNNVHTTNENIAINSIVKSAELVAAIIQQMI
ncbi:MAG: M20/M25/M40 family metallo-hydrolase [Bacillota bacterium]